MIRPSLVVALLLASGCAPYHEAFRTVDSSVLSNEFQGYPLDAAEVEVFLATDEVPEDCRRVALLRAVPTVSVVNNLREEAGRLGANAVDLRDFRTGSHSRHDQGDVHWDAVALHCPEGGG